MNPSRKIGCALIFLFFLVSGCLLFHTEKTFAFAMNPFIPQMVAAQKQAKEAEQAKEDNEDDDEPDKVQFSYPEFGQEVNLNDPNGFDIHRSDINDFETFGQRFIRFMSGVVVLITILVFMIGAGFWIFSSGNESLVERGKDMMIYSLVGILMVLGAYVIVKVVQIILYSLGT